MTPRRAFWALFATGLILPWITALAVRTVLILLDLPVMDWEWIGGMVPVFSAMTVLFSLPFLVLGGLCALYRRTAPDRRLPVAGWALAGAAASLILGTILIHIGLWISIEAIEWPLLLPLDFLIFNIGMALPGGLLGAVYGWLETRRAA